MLLTSDIVGYLIFMENLNYAICDMIAIVYYDAKLFFIDFYCQYTSGLCLNLPNRTLGIEEVFIQHNGVSAWESSNAI
jgi:hypothetical protein